MTYLKTTSLKPRVCLALPGIQYTPQSPYVRSTLPMVPYLEKDFDIVLAYRKIINLHSPDHIHHKFLTILDSERISKREKRNTHPYFQPQHYPALWKYQNEIKHFAKQHASEFDLVFEKEWPWLGAFVREFSELGVPTSMLIEAMYKRPPSTKLGISKKIASLGLQSLRTHKRAEWSRKADSLVVETDEMKSVVLDYQFSSPTQPIYPIPYGVDAEVFKLRDRRECREKLSIPAEKVVLSYVGSLNRFIQEPGPVIIALGKVKPKDVVFHIIGDGSKRQELEDLAQKYDAPVIFHGRLPQSEAALYISAANLCVAPYNKHLYLGDRFTCASLKVPEYLSCGRLILSIPCERMEKLSDQQNYGYLVSNRTEDYINFFENFPDSEELKHKEEKLICDLQEGILKEKKIVLRWWDIANMYKQVFEKTLGI